MSNTWQPTPLPDEREKRARRGAPRGSLDGLVIQARTTRRVPVGREGPNMLDVWVGPEPPPDTPRGRLWFDTDEPV